MFNEKRELMFYPMEQSHQAFIFLLNQFIKCCGWKIPHRMASRLTA